MGRKGRKVQPQIDWKNLTPKHTVKTVKVPDKGYARGTSISPHTTHYETGSGTLITWSGNDARQAISSLRRRSSKTVTKKR